MIHDAGAQNTPPVSILVLMDLCIKTNSFFGQSIQYQCFNPCFNGSMYKNGIWRYNKHQGFVVSILVLMDLCIKTVLKGLLYLENFVVSILVLMDLCIKTRIRLRIESPVARFNPCFNGSMYKNLL